MILKNGLVFLLVGADKTSPGPPLGPASKEKAFNSCCNFLRELTSVVKAKRRNRLSNPATCAKATETAICSTVRDFHLDIRDVTTMLPYSDIDSPSVGRPFSRFNTVAAKVSVPAKTAKTVL